MSVYEQTKLMKKSRHDIVLSQIKRFGMHYKMFVNIWNKDLFCNGKMYVLYIFNKVLDVHKGNNVYVKCRIFQLALDLMYEKTEKDLITGLRTKTQPGRPDWNKVSSRLLFEKQKNKKQTNKKLYFHHTCVYFVGTFQGRKHFIDLYYWH